MWPLLGQPRLGAGSQHGATWSIDLGVVGVRTGAWIQVNCWGSSAFARVFWAINKMRPKMGSVILASQSPRRRQILEKQGIVFDVVVPDIDETPRLGERPRDLVRRLAATKAVNVGQRYPEFAVIGADTVVAVDDMILGKPSNAAQARTMLQTLSGRSHDVYTGVAVWRECANQGAVVVAVAQIVFRSLSLGEIDHYIASGEPLDKAGAYAIQGAARDWVESYQGNLQTVIGLPGDVVVRLLRDANEPVG